MRAVSRPWTVVRGHIREGRFQRSLALVAGLAGMLSGLEVLTEHYRGSYSQRVMYSPVILSPALLIAGAWAAISRRAARTVLPAVSLLTILDGLVGFAFHVRGIKRKPGGWRVPIFNLVMGPPVFAPLLFAISGYLGLIASLLRREGETINTETQRHRDKSEKSEIPLVASSRLTGGTINTEARRHGEGTEDETPSVTPERNTDETPAFRSGRLICSASAVFRPLVSLVARRVTPVCGRLVGSVADEGGLNPAARRAHEPPRPKGRGFISAERPHLSGFAARRLRYTRSRLAAQVAEGRLQQQFAVAAAVSALFSGIEALYSHYKNNFRYRSQWTPILLTPVIVVAGMGAVVSKTVARTLLPVASILALLDGGVGFVFHMRGMLRRPGGTRYPLYNLMYGPPIFAPLLFAASGFLGLLATLLRRAE